MTGETAKYGNIILKKELFHAKIIPLKLPATSSAKILASAACCSSVFFATEAFAAEPRMFRRAGSTQVKLAFF